MDPLDQPSLCQALLPVFSARYPPCRVCNAKASGVHYGITTCEACKGFFCRCMTRKTPLKCRSYGSCVIEHGRKHCPACRLKKCLYVGMSKACIKVGRSNYIQVTRAIEEVKQLELQLKMRHDGTLVSPEEHLAQLDSICDKIATTHLTYSPHSAQFYEVAYEQERLFLERQCLEDKLFGRRSIIGRTEYNNIYNQTKLDVDGRRSVLEALAPLMQTAYDNFHIFAKSVPGFKQLSKIDQTELLKAGIMDTTSILYNALHNTDEGVYVNPLDPSIVIKLEYMLGYTDQPRALYAHIIRHIERLQQLELTLQETIIAAALTLLITDAELSDVGRKILNSSADNLAEALYRMMQRNHDDKDKTYTKLMTAIYDKRKVLHDIQNYQSNAVQDSHDIPLPKIVTDLYGE